MTKDPIKRQANNARDYDKRKANNQGQQNNNSQNRNSGDWQDSVLNAIS